MSNTVATDTIRTMDRHEAGAARTAHPPRPPHPPHPPSEAIAALEHRAPRTTLIDRIAMRIGLQLLLWSTRPAMTRDKAQAAYRLRREAQQLEAQRAALIGSMRLPC